MIDDPFSKLLQLAESAAREIQALPISDVVPKSSIPVEAAGQAPTPQSQQAGPAQVTLSLSDELMFAFMHWQLNGDWSAMEAAIDCSNTLKCLKQLWDELIACKARAGPLLETYVAAAVRGRSLEHAFSLAVSCLSSLERSKLLAASKPAERHALQQVLAEIELPAAGQQGRASCAPALRSALVASCASLRPAQPRTKSPCPRSRPTSPQELYRETQNQLQAHISLGGQHAPWASGAATSSQGAVAVAAAAAAAEAAQGSPQACTSDVLAFPQASVQQQFEVDLDGSFPAALDTAPHRQAKQPWTQRLQQLLQQQQLQVTRPERAGLQSTSSNCDMEALQQHQVQTRGMQYGAALVGDHSQSFSSDQPVMCDATVPAATFNQAARHAQLSEDAQTHPPPVVPTLNFPENQQSPQRHHLQQQQQYEHKPSPDLVSLLQRLAASSGGAQEVLQLLPQLPSSLKQELLWQLQHVRSKTSNTTRQHQGSPSAPSDGLPAGSAAEHPFKAAAFLQSGHRDSFDTAPTHGPPLQPRLDIPPAELVLQMLQSTHRDSACGTADYGGMLPAGISSGAAHHWTRDSSAASSKKLHQNLSGPDQAAGSTAEAVLTELPVWPKVPLGGTDLSSDRRPVPSVDIPVANITGQEPLGHDPDLSKSRPRKRRARSAEQTDEDEVREPEGKRPQHN